MGNPQTFSSPAVEPFPWPAALGVSIAVFLFLSGLSAWVHETLQEQRRAEMQRHLEDISGQAARRVEVFIRSRLDIASLFAVRWATHEHKDYSRSRFEEFSTVLLRELPGFHAAEWISPDFTTRWQTPPAVKEALLLSQDAIPTICNQARQAGQAVVLVPPETPDVPSHFLAVLPLVSRDQLLGYVSFTILSQTLIEESFHSRIRSEFVFTVSANESVLFQSETSKEANDAMSSRLATHHTFPLAGVTWELAMSPKQPASGRQAFLTTTDWLLPLWGFVLSLALSSLSFLLIRRIHMTRVAHARALSEINERQRAQTTLHHLESRYHSVFEATTDGMIILDTDGRPIEANRQALRLFHGTEFPFLSGWTLESSFDEAARRLWHGSLERMQRRSRMDFEARLIGAQGKPFSAYVQLIRFEYGHKTRLLMLVTDITERKQAEEEQRRLGRKVLMAQEEERLRISRDLHDELGQILTALRLELDFQTKRLNQNGEKPFERATVLLQKAADELRTICRGLRPPLLDDLGLESAVRQLVRQTGQQTDLVMDLDLNLPDNRPIPKEAALCVYRILQEGLTNVRRHSLAHSVSVSLHGTLTELVLSVYDDGIGFDPASRLPGGGSGITGMRERAALVDGVLELRSIPQEGTRLELRIPFSPPNEGLA